MDSSILIVTYNRADTLQGTLQSLARIVFDRSWEVLVVDNNSMDRTREVVAEARDGFPAPLRYCLEPTPGKYWALNTGIRAAAGHIIAASDDDASPEPDWLQRAMEGFEAFGADFVGGPAFPRWQAPPPDWLDWRSPLCGKVLGLLDAGPVPREFGRDGLSWPLGVNVAYRRRVFERVGLFDGRLGRVAGTLRNQSQREWHLRAHAAGLRGMYLPGMVVHHSVEAERLTRRYFLRWFYWHGISRAILHQTKGLHLSEPESGRTHAGERRLLAVPLSIWRDATRAAASAAKRWVLGKRAEAFEYELLVAFNLGVLHQLWRPGTDLALQEPLRADPEPLYPAQKAS